VLLRDLAEAGAAILLYTSELKEVQLVCDRTIVIFGGQVVREMSGVDADEPALLRAAYNLRSDSALPEEEVAELVAQAAEDAPGEPPEPPEPPASPADETQA
jgi:ribose transport system ATP-binding protein